MKDICVHDGTMRLHASPRQVVSGFLIRERDINFYVV